MNVSTFFLWKHGHDLSPNLANIGIGCFEYTRLNDWTLRPHTPAPTPHLA